MTTVIAIVVHLGTGGREIFTLKPIFGYYWILKKGYKTESTNGMVSANECGLYRRLEKVLINYVHRYKAILFTYN